MEVSLMREFLLENATRGDLIFIILGIIMVIIALARVNENIYEMREQNRYFQLLVLELLVLDIDEDSEFDMNEKDELIKEIRNTTFEMLSEHEKENILKNMHSATSEMDDDLDNKDGDM
jgi:hypothetical protein